MIIKPNIVGDLHWVESSYNSVHGRIVSNWKRENATVTMNVTTPPNTTATVFVPVASKPGEDGPAKAAAGVTESGKPVAQAGGVKFLRMGNSSAVFTVGSGTCRFQSKLGGIAK